jgi:hypothetical protein
VGCLFGGLAIIYGFIVLALIVWAPPDLENWFRPRLGEPFSKALWDSTRFGDARRYRMADNLVRARHLIGKSEQDVRDLLGKPSSEDHHGMEILIGYNLVSQKDLPARCKFLPDFLFLNMETWLLEIQVEDGVVKAVRIRFT